MKTVTHLCIVLIVSTSIFSCTPEALTSEDTIEQISMDSGEIDNPQRPNDPDDED